MKFKLIITIFGLIIIGAVIFVGYWFNSGEQRLQKKLNANFLTQITNKLDEVINNPHCQYGINNAPPQVDASTICSGHMYWIENGYKIGMHYARSEEVLAPDHIRANLVAISRGLDQYFSQLGFVKDSINTQISSIAEDANDYTYAYSNDDMKCLINFTEITNKGLSNFFPFWIGVSCGSITNKDRQIFKDYFTIANPNKEPDLIFFLAAIDSNYARLDTHFTRSGSELLVKKVNGYWTAPLAPSQEYPMCSDVDRLGFPRSIYRNCLLKDYSLREPID